MRMMDRTMEREALFARINQYLMLGYILLALCMAAINIWKGLPYYYLLAFGTILIFPVVMGAFSLFKLKRSHQMMFSIYVYSLLAFLLGVACTFYHVVPYYDKIMHTLSGVLTVLLALPIYYMLKPGRRVERTDRNQVIVFVILAAIAVAGIWEIGEYILSLLTGMDNQNVLTTGIHDTMQDMIVCTIGALLTIPAISAYYNRGRRGLLMSAFDGFAVQNLDSTIK